MSGDGEASVGASPERTIGHAIGCVGVGLHSGARVALTLRPAPARSGIRFHRIDRPGAPAIAAHHDRVVTTTLGTTLGVAGGPKVATVEHVLAALAACRIDNVDIEIGGPEVPIMDGSAQPFVFLIECAGMVEQDAPRRVIEILRPVEVRQGDGWARLEPADGFAMACEIDFPHPLIGRQSLALERAVDAARTALVPARTFGFAAEIDELHARGLARGGSLKNAVVLDEQRVLNPEGLRFRDEPVRHKMLDALGDLYLAGAPIQGRFSAFRPGHGLTSRLLGALLAEPDVWRMRHGDAVGLVPSRPEQVLMAG